jgi:hypothetical protein
MRLAAYVGAFRDKDWSTLYGLVSSDGKHGLGWKKFNFAMDESYLVPGAFLPRLRKFTPVRTQTALEGTAFDIYGCASSRAQGINKEGIAAVRASYENGNWVFTTWDYADPLEPCADLSQADWKPPRYAPRLEGPMPGLECFVVTCIL